ncbi:hypothetical protein ACJJIP_13855 [Microbulbifer sp. VTAC004]|uniref:hypothetical protein n=1 Tax=Microbulbifer sp. VTAC004 TaxID=3243386 RepID=UPI0040393A5E
MKLVIHCLVVLVVVYPLVGCGEKQIELSNIRMEKIDRLEAKKLIPDDQRLPFNVRQSVSISIVEFDFDKKKLEVLPEEGGVLKVELLRCLNGEQRATSFIYARKINVSLSTNKREALLPVGEAYFFVDSSLVEDTCFTVVFKSLSRTTKSTIYRLP